MDKESDLRRGEISKTVLSVLDCCPLPLPPRVSQQRPMHPGRRQPLSPVRFNAVIQTKHWPESLLRVCFRKVCFIEAEGISPLPERQPGRFFSRSLFILGDPGRL